jgi:histidinol-phosphatase
MNPSFSKEAVFIEQLLVGASQMIPGISAKQDFAVVTKEDHTPVTDIDHKVEAYFRTELAREFPADTILGEEEGGEISPHGRSWVFDPLDGTRNFVRRIPHVASGIVFLSKGKPVASGVYLVDEKRVLIAQRGGGVWTRPLSQKNWEHVVLPRPDERLAIVNFTRGRTLGQSKLVLRALDALLPYTFTVRTFGSSLESFAYFVLGRTDLMLCCHTTLWDELPGQLLALEAGAIMKSITDQKNEATINFYVHRGFADQIDTVIKELK